MYFRNRDTIEFLGLWEKMNNPNFKPVEFEGFRNEAGKNSFVLSPQKWIIATGAIGIVLKSGSMEEPLLIKILLLSLLPKIITQQ